MIAKFSQLERSSIFLPGAVSKEADAHIAVVDDVARSRATGGAPMRRAVACPTGEGSRVLAVTDGQHCPAGEQPRGMSRSTLRCPKQQVTCLEPTQGGLCWATRNNRVLRAANLTSVPDVSSRGPVTVQNGLGAACDAGNGGTGRLWRP